MRALLVIACLFVMLRGGLSVGASIVFDTTDDRLTCGDVDLSGGMTLGAWINTSGSAGFRTIVNRRTSAAGANGDYLLNMDADEELQVCYRAGGAFRCLQDVGDGVPLNTWTHVAGTFDDATDTFNLYKNGVNIATGTNTNALTSNTAVWWIGAYPTAEFFPGEMEEVAVWTVALTANEILQWATSKTRRMPLQIQPSNLRMYWTVDDGPDGTSADGDSVKDFSTSVNTCTGDDGANNTGLTWAGSRVLTYP